MRSFLDRVILMQLFYSFHHFKYILPIFSGQQISVKRAAVNLLGIPLYVICCFFFVALNIFSLCLIFISLIYFCLGMFSFGLILYGTLDFLDLGGYFPSHIRELFNYNLLKYFLTRFFLSFSSTCMIIRFSCVDSLPPQGLQPIRLLNPSDSLGKNIGLCCHVRLL